MGVNTTEKYVVPQICCNCGSRPGSRKMLQTGSASVDAGRRKYEWRVPICPECEKKLAGKTLTPIWGGLALFAVVTATLMFQMATAPPEEHASLITGSVLFALLAAVIILGLSLLTRKLFFSRHRLSSFDGRYFKFKNEQFFAEFARLNPDLVDPAFTPAENDASPASGGEPIKKEAVPDEDVEPLSEDGAPKEQEKESGERSESVGIETKEPPVRVRDPLPEEMTDSEEPEAESEPVGIEIKEPPRKVRSQLPEYLSDSEEPEELTPTDSSELKEAGDLALAEDTRLEGMERLREFIKRHPDCSAPYCLLAQALSAHSRKKEAAILLMEAFPKVGRKSRVANSLGLLFFFELGNLDESIHWFLKSIYAMSAKPDLWEPYIHLSGIFAEFKRRAEAAGLKRAADSIRGSSTLLDHAWLKRFEAMMGDRRQESIEQPLLQAYEDFIKDSLQNIERNAT